LSLAPSYQQTHFPDTEKRGQFRLIVSPDGANDSLRIHQDVRLYSALLDGMESIDWQQDAARKAYVHLARGSVTVNGIAMHAGDGLRITDEPALKFTDGSEAEVLLFDLPDQ
jgi:hypothetical protein